MLNLKFLAQPGVTKGSRDLLLEFWDTSISRERFELETSNLACRLTTGGTNDKNGKLGQRRSGRGHVGQRRSGKGHVGPPPYLGNGLS